MQMAQPIGFYPIPQNRYMSPSQWADFQEAQDRNNKDDEDKAFDYEECSIQRVWDRCGLWSSGFVYWINWLCR